MTNSLNTIGKRVGYSAKFAVANSTMFLCLLGFLSFCGFNTTTNFLVNTFVMVMGSAFVTMLVYTTITKKTPNIEN